MSARRISKRADRTWKRLASWYGARLAEQYGDNPPEDWADLIDRTDDERLEQALAAVRRASPTHPPTLGQLEAAVPSRHLASDPSSVSILSAAAMRMLGKSLCMHQIAMPWNYFGPVEEFASKNRDGEIVSHPRVRGVQIPPCAACGTQSRRLLLDDVVGAAA